jgi:hypothetical protein
MLRLLTLDYELRYPKKILRSVVIFCSFFCFSFSLSLSVLPGAFAHKRAMIAGRKWTSFLRLCCFTHLADFIRRVTFFKRRAPRFAASRALLLHSLRVSISALTRASSSSIKLEEVCGVDGSELSGALAAASGLLAPFLGRTGRRSGLTWGLSSE